MHTYLTVLGLFWTVSGFLGFAHFVFANQDTLRQMASEEIEASAQDTSHAAFMVFLGGPVVWSMLLVVLFRRATA
jgi:hypothetical protein